jgi:ribonucleoside-diphosphate reductase beta chain
MPLIGKKKVTDGIKLDTNLNVFSDLYKKQKQAIRFPEEINVWLDLVDYKSMSADEQWLFQELIGYFLTSELLVQNVLWESFYPYIIDPRAKMSMTVQMFMEDIHSDFFEMILNTFTMNRDELYNKSTNNAIMREKQEMVARAANAISISSGGVDPDTLEGKKAILHAILLNNIIQEWIFFYSAFALYFAIRETGKMKNVCNGIDLVLIDESLHLQMGIELILTIIDENPEIVQDNVFVNNMRSTMIDATELELKFIRELFGSRMIFGVSYNEMEQYLKYITDRRLTELWFDQHYLVVENPLKFLQKQDLKTLQNFFETTPNQYTNF